MSYTTPQKALELAHEIADKLKIRVGALQGVAGLAVTEGFDTDGLPTISVGPGTAGSKNVFIKVNLQAWPLAKDILGNSANIYTPLTVQFVTEAPPAGSGAGVIVDLPTLLACLGDCVMKGSRTEWYQSANGVAPVAASITAGNLKAAFQPDIYNILTNQQ
jgi:hypothetical protein